MGHLSLQEHIFTHHTHPRIYLSHPVTTGPPSQLLYHSQNIFYTPCIHFTTSHDLSLEPQMKTYPWSQYISTSQVEQQTKTVPLGNRGFFSLSIRISPTGLPDVIPLTIPGTKFSTRLPGPCVVNSIHNRTCSPRGVPYGIPPSQGTMSSLSEFGPSVGDVIGDTVRHTTYHVISDSTRSCHPDSDPPFWHWHLSTRVTFHLKIETRLIDEMFVSVMGECVILTPQARRRYSI